MDIYLLSGWIALAGALLICIPTVPIRWSVFTYLIVIHFDLANLAFDSGTAFDTGTSIGFGNAVD